MRWLFLMSMCCLLLAPMSIKAEPHDFGPVMFSASLPANWQAEQEFAEYVTFRPATGSCEVGIFSKDMLFADASLWAAKRAAMWERANTLRALPDGQGFVFLRKDGRRCWLDIRDGWLLEISVTGSSKELPALFRGFQANAQAPGLARILATLSASPTALNWLGSGGTAPGAVVPPVPVPVFPDFAIYGQTKDALLPPVLQGSLPAGWSVASKGSWLVVLSKNGKHWAASRYYPPLSEDNDASENGSLWKTMQAVIPLLGGRNFSISEGTGNCDTPTGFAHLNRAGNTLQVSIYSDQMALDELFPAMP